MIVVGFGKGNHDCNICVSIDGKIKYAKYEREFNIKHSNAPDYWFWKKLIEWNINISKIDLLVETDHGNFMKQYKVPRLPINGDPFYFKAGKKQKEIILDHHLAHAWSNMSFNKYKQSIVVDGSGSGLGPYTSLVYSKEKLFRFEDDSPAGIYNFISSLMNLHSGEFGTGSGKLMGLMPYGKINQNLLYKLIKEFPYFFNPTLLEIIKLNCLNKNIQDPVFLDFLKTIDELCFIRLLKYFDYLNKSEEIIYAGGCALNVDWNRRLINLGYKLNIEPHVYDGGLSIGCVRFGHDFLKIEQPNFKNFPYIQDDEDPNSVPSIKTIEKVSELLSNNKIVGWYQSKGEIGPRSLGNRSILMNPTIKNGKDILNKKVKFREWWRPYGASVKEEKASNFFDMEYSPYMLYTSKVLSNNLDSITHIDKTCRHQTVNSNQNIIFYELLSFFEKKTGIPILLNTSLNLAGNPISGTIKQAKKILYETELDAMCIGDNLIIK
jgi:carbamoyltransferase